jgi:hypothetical protein
MSRLRLATGAPSPPRAPMYPMTHPTKGRSH